jgi:hypothetical protein
MQPHDLKLILTVLHSGLVGGLLSTAEVKDWADSMLITKFEPESLLIDLSLTEDKNKLISLIKEEINGYENPVAVRVLFGLAYRQLLCNAITIEMIINLCNKLAYQDILTPFEANHMNELDFEFVFLYQENIDHLEPEFTNYLFAFLDHYKDFELSNHLKWPEINGKIEDVLKAEAEIKSVTDQVPAGYSKHAFRNTVIIAVSVTLLVLTIQLYKGNPPVARFQQDLMAIGILVTDLFVCYLVVWLLAKVIKRIGHFGS